jgi:hypothetical protein
MILSEAQAAYEKAREDFNSHESECVSCGFTDDPEMCPKGLLLWEAYRAAKIEMRLAKARV